MLLPARHDVVAQGLVGAVVPEFVGQDPLDAGFGGRVDEFGLLVWGGAHAHGDDEGVLVAEGGDEGAGVGVIDFLDADARGHGGGAAFAGDGGDVVLARGEEGFHDVLAACAAGLGGFWLALFSPWYGDGFLGNVYADDCDVLDVV